MRLPRPRLTLAATMGLVVVIAALLAGVVVPARARRDAAAAIARAGGSVVYDWQLEKPSPGARLKPKTRPRVPAPRTPPGPEWLRRTLGPDVFDVPKRVRFVARAEVDDAVMAQVARLESIEFLQVAVEPKLSPAGMAEVAKLPRLIEFDVFSGDATGFLPHLRGLTELKFLTLSSVDPSEADMDALARLPRLEMLYLGGGRLSEAKLLILAESRTLLRLDILGPSPWLSDEVMSRLRAGLPGVEIRAYDPSKLGVPPPRPVRRAPSTAPR